MAAEVQEVVEDYMVQEEYQHLLDMVETVDQIQYFQQ